MPLGKNQPKKRCGLVASENMPSRTTLTQANVCKAISKRTSLMKTYSKLIDIALSDEIMDLSLKSAVERKTDRPEVQEVIKLKEQLKDILRVKILKKDKAFQKYIVSQISLNSCKKVMSIHDKNLRRKNEHSLQNGTEQRKAA